MDYTMMIVNSFLGTKLLTNSVSMVLFNFIPRWQWACVFLTIVKLLISYGASVNQKDCNGSTPLHLGEPIPSPQMSHSQSTAVSFPVHNHLIPSPQPSHSQSTNVSFPVHRTSCWSVGTVRQICTKVGVALLSSQAYLLQTCSNILAAQFYWVGRISLLGTSCSYVASMATSCIHFCSYGICWQLYTAVHFSTQLAAHITWEWSLLSSRQVRHPALTLPQLCYRNI